MAELATIQIQAVIKGCHALKRKVPIGTQLKVEPDLENSVDDYAMGVYNSTNQIIGHVPATPVALNKALYKIFYEHGTVSITCLVTGLMQGSKHPWPQTKEKGGGVVMPCEYLVEIEKRHEEEIWSLLVNLIDQSKCPGLITIVRDNPSGSAEASHNGMGHGASHNSKGDGGKEVCNFFANNGWCRFGERCRYKHVPITHEIPSVFLADDDDDDYLDEEDYSYMGFSHDDMQELLCQGINPFKEDYDFCVTALGALNNGGDDVGEEYLENPLPKGMCHFFLRNGWCRYGKNCRYSHGTGGAAALGPETDSKGQKICQYYKHSTCRFGDQCRNSHE